VGIFAGGFMLFCSGSCDNPAPHPTTKEEFIAAFTKAYEAGDLKTIEAWANWGDTPEELRSDLLRMCMFFAGKNKVVSIKCEEYDPRFIRERVNKGETLHFSLKPVFWFSFETRGHAGFEGGESSSYGRGALGYDGGKLYFCGPNIDFGPWRAKHPRKSTSGGGSSAQ